MLMWAWSPSIRDEVGRLRIKTIQGCSEIPSQETKMLGESCVYFHNAFPVSSDWTVEWRVATNRQGGYTWPSRSRHPPADPWSLASLYTHVTLSLKV